MLLKCRVAILAVFISAAPFALSGCGGDGAPAARTVASATVSCDPLPSTAVWTPNIPGVSQSNHDSSVSVRKDVYTSAQAPLTGISEAYDDGGAHVITISNIDMNADLGLGGSMSLNAEAVELPAELQKQGYSVWPALISLSLDDSSVTNSARELVNVQGCNSGFDLCTVSGGNYNCSARANCGPGVPSAYIGATSDQRRDHWEQRQRLWSDTGVSVNTFPTCDWTTGSPSCPFPSTYFANGKLRMGTYTAKYVLLSSFLNNPTAVTYPTGYYKGKIKLSVVRKTKASAAKGGAMDLNVVIVGNKNIAASRSAKGQQNLDSMFAYVMEHYHTENPASTNIQLGKVTVYEWDCAHGGETYSNVSLDDTGTMFAEGSKLVDPASEGKALNIFMVSRIPYSGAGSILGRSGGIVGSMVNGTTSSGLVFATFNYLDKFNPGCTDPIRCPRNLQDSDFIDMGSTISHEIGHFLGLNHPSESDGITHDAVPDTPECTLAAGRAYVNWSGCWAQNGCNTACPAYNAGATIGGLCPTETSCQFNHTMWWTSKSYDADGNGDGNIFSDNSGSVVNYSPYVQ